ADRQQRLPTIERASPHSLTYRSAAELLFRHLMAHSMNEFAIHAVSTEVCICALPMLESATCIQSEQANIRIVRYGRASQLSIRYHTMCADKHNPTRQRVIP
ncbi:MAG: hypothetical protein AB2L11_02595, partial [Syntrophobacteraceae bacterium]